MSLRISSANSVKSGSFSAGSDHGLDARPPCRQRLLTNTADRQHQAAQRDLARHGDVAPDRHLRAADRIAVAIVTPADGPSFGMAPAGVDVQVLLRESPVKFQLPGVCPNVAQGGSRRFLHHIPELARQDNVLVPARKQGRFDKKHVSTGLRPRQAGRDAGSRRPERHLLLEAGGSQIALQISGAITVVADRGYRAGASRSSPPPFARVSPSWRSRFRTPASRVYSLMISRRSRRESPCAFRQPVLVHLTRQQVLARDVDLFFLAIAGSWMISIRSSRAG